VIQFIPSPARVSIRRVTIQKILVTLRCIVVGHQFKDSILRGTDERTVRVLLDELYIRLQGSVASNFSELNIIEILLSYL